MSPREPSGRHITEGVADFDDDVPESRRVRKNDVTISLPVKAMGGILMLLLGGGGIYGGHLLGAQHGDRAVAELQAMDTRVRKIEDARLEDAGERKRRDQQLDDKMDRINGKLDDLSEGIDKISARLDRRR